jgi:hypothetical protein
MLTPAERIAKLEEEVAALKRELEVVAGFPINMLRVILDRLVDDRELAAEWRQSLWRDIEAEAGEIGIGSPAVRRAARHVVPRPTHGQIVQAQRRGDRKPLLRPKLGIRTEGEHSDPPES